MTDQILTYFYGLTLIRISHVQAKIVYILAWKTAAYFPRQILSLLLKFNPKTMASGTPHPGLNRTTDKPVTAGGHTACLASNCKLITILFPALVYMQNVIFIFVTWPQNMYLTLNTAIRNFGF
jgi:hypothetical protein